MEYCIKRTIIPMNDWDKFLKEGRDEFNKFYLLKSDNKFGKEDFDFIKTLGKGAFGRVYLTKMVKNGHYYAIKILDKRTIVRRRQLNHTMNEKKILQSLNMPFCVYLEYGFHDNSYLYLCLPYVIGGDMFKHLRKMHKFEETLSKFYGAQVLLAFEYLHYCNMVFRDLKPENILIDQNGYLKLTDFGFCKIVKGRTYTMCGTPEYLAPEIILNKGYGQAVDWWAYGVLLYEMSAGHPPFQAHEQMKILDKISTGNYDMPKFFSSELRDLIENILQVDLSRRYGNLRDGIKDIKEHYWYKDMDWIALFNGRLEAPFIPTVQGEGDTSNFDHYTEETMRVASKDVFSKQFEDF